MKVADPDALDAVYVFYVGNFIGYTPLKYQILSTLSVILR